MKLTVKKHQTNNWSIVMGDKVLADGLSKELAIKLKDAWGRTPGVLKRDANALKRIYRDEYQKNLKKVDKWLTKAMKRNEYVSKGRKLPKKMYLLYYMLN